MLSLILKDYNDAEKSGLFSLLGTHPSNQNYIKVWDICNQREFNFASKQVTVFGAVDHYSIVWNVAHVHMYWLYRKEQRRNLEGSPSKVYLSLTILQNP